MQHIVYMIELHRDKLPQYYIGSKSNCSIVEGKIIDRRGKNYTGSAKDTSLKEAIKSGCPYSIHVLGTFDVYETALENEKLIQIQNDVVASPYFFNRSLACENTYTNPEYATYKHSLTGKVARLRRDHPDVISRVWVGMTAGVVLDEESRKKRGRPGNSNPFFGRKHTAESKAKSGKKIGDAHRGKPKSDEHRRKQSEAAKRRWENARKEREAGRSDAGL